jgi:hypothetical protein
VAGVVRSAGEDAFMQGGGSQSERSMLWPAEDDERLKLPERQLGAAVCTGPTADVAPSC